MEPMPICVAMLPAAARQRTRQALARRPDAVDEVLYEFNAVGYAIHSWQLGTLHILVLEHEHTLSRDDQQHILRITDNNQKFLDELLAIQCCQDFRETTPAT